MVSCHLTKPNRTYIPLHQPPQPQVYVPTWFFHCLENPALAPSFADRPYNVISEQISTRLRIGKAKLALAY